MPGLGLSGTRAAPRNWWPANAGFAVDFIAGLAMRNRIICPLAEAMSFTRSSSKLALDLSGRWQSFAPDIPAITTSGIAIEPASGIAIEPARTNLIVANTANSGTGFAATSTAIRTDLPAGDSPAGDSFGKLVTQGSGASDGLNFGLFFGLITAGSTHAASAAFKYSGSTRYLRFALSDNVSVVRECWVDLLDKIVGNASPGSTTRLTPLIDGWIGLDLIAANFPNASSSSQLGVTSVAGMGNTARTAGAYKMWGGQIEKDQTTATSPILTPSAARAADNLVLALPPGAQQLSLVLGDGTTHLLSVAGGAYTVPLNLPHAYVRRAVAMPD